MRLATVAAVAASISGAAAGNILGFNSGATYDDKSIKKQADYEKEFNAQAKLQNSPGSFTSVRLYTNIQPDTTDDPIEAFPAAMATNTTILLGMWCSGTTDIKNELSALSKAIDKYGKNFTDLVVGISVGSEDLYRNSADGVKNKAGVGQSIDTIISFIKDTRDTIKNTALAKTPVGHVDTWTVWANETNKDVISQVDFLGTDLYPYYESGDNVHMTNEITNAVPIFYTALNATLKAAGDKPVWITETGWPTTGPKWNEAQPSVENAKTYWDDVGCSIFGKYDTWWYIMHDSNPDNKMKFGLNTALDGKPQYDLTCPSQKGAPASTNTNGTTTNSTSNGNGNGNTNSNKPSAGAVMGVSRMNAAALGLSMVFALVAWAA